MHTVCVFISHSWSYSDHYDKLAEWIFQMPWSHNGESINFIDSSVPRENPIHYAPTSGHLRDAIYQRISSSDVVVIPMGMYANHSEWIQKEIDGAHIFGRPILAVNPWAQERKSSIVAQAARESVGWNSGSVVNGIWRLRNG